MYWFYLAYCQLKGRHIKTTPRLEPFASRMVRSVSVRPRNSLKGCAELYIANVLRCRGC